MDITTMQYAFTGQVLMTVLRQQKNWTTTETNLILTRNTYNTNGQLVKTEKKINPAGTSDPWKAVSALTYDDPGKLKIKKLAPDYNSG